MSDNKSTENEIKELVLSTFHLDKLCPKCKKPMEIENTISCKMCAIKKKLRSQLDIANNALHSIKMTIGGKQ